MAYIGRSPSASLRYPNHPGSRTGSPETNEHADTGCSSAVFDGPDSRTRRLYYRTSDHEMRAMPFYSAA